MNAIKTRVDYLFRSTRGLALMAIALISLVTAIWGMLSGPMVEWGVSDFVARTLGMTLLPSQREGRIIMLYHSISLAVVAIETYFITDIVRMRKHEQATINGTITAGYLLTMIFGLWFGYFGQNFVFHGLFLFGQSLVFFAGILLAAALWPWRKEDRLPPGSPYAARAWWVEPGTCGLLHHGGGHIRFSPFRSCDRLILGQRA